MYRSTCNFLFCISCSEDLVTCSTLLSKGCNSIQTMEEEMAPLPHIVADEEAQQVDCPVYPAQKRRRGKAIDWKFVKKIPSIAEAKADFSRNNLLGNEQFLGRKYTGKTSAIYINCQKVVCGCNKKWRLVSSQSTEEVVLEETSEDHSNHELFLRGGGNGLSPQQVEVTQEALAQNSRMKPLQIIHYFKDKITKDLAIGTETSIISTITSKLNESSFVTTYARF
jgi:hypothetical protein